MTSIISVCLAPLAPLFCSQVLSIGLALLYTHRSGGEANPGPGSVAQQREDERRINGDTSNTTGDLWNPCGQAPL